jgi:hypothetical protein
MFLRLSVKRVYVAARTPASDAGSIPHVRFGGEYRFIPADVREWAAAGFPPAATFMQWKDFGQRRQKKAS